MSKKLPRVDLSFLANFRFVLGTGNYADREVCIMSGLALAVAIAEGKITLGDALDPESNHLEEQDYVSCVSNTIRSVVISRNDEFPEDEEGVKLRTAWALKYMPKLLGTRRGAAFEKKLDRTRRDVAKNWYRVEALRLARIFIDSEGYEDLNELKSHLETTDEDMNDDEETNTDILNAQLDALLIVVTEDDKRRAERRQKDAERREQA